LIIFILQIERKVKLSLTGNNSQHNSSIFTRDSRNCHSAS